MTMHKKVSPAILFFGFSNTLLSSFNDEINDLNVEIIESEISEDFNKISTSSEIILILTTAKTLREVGFDSINKLRRNNIGDGFLMVLADSRNSDLDFLGESRDTFMEILYPPISPAQLRYKIINHLDSFERKNELNIALHELEKNKRRLAADGQKIKILTNAVNEPIIFVDHNLMVNSWNKEAKSFFGYTKYEVVNESFLRWLVAPKSHVQVKELFEDVKKSGAGILKREQSFLFRNKLGVEIKAEATLSYHKIDKDNFNLVFVIHDTSSEKKLEKETQRARELREENKLMRELLSFVSHELRTPLNAIVGISKTLLSYNSANLTERQGEGITLVQKSGEQLLGTIKDLLGISRLEANKLNLVVESFDFDKLLSQQKTQTLNLIGKKNIKFVVKRSSAIPNKIIGDQKKINQILTNVVGNAVKYTTEGKIILSSHLIDNKLYFEVLDTGVGIPKDKLSTIFEKFTRVSSNSKMSTGTGLGLHITKKLIELMSGEIKVKSELGKGTNIRFFVTLPDEVRPIKPPQIKPKIVSTDLRILNYSPNRKLILVIDDSVENSFIYSILSEQGKYSVMLCSSSKRVLTIAYEYMPDLIILKLEMPALHGSSIIKELRRKEVNVPVIAFSEFENYITDLPSNTILLDEPMSLESLFPVLQEEIEWESRKKLKGVVIVEEDAWFIKEIVKGKGFIEIYNKEESLTYVKICQHKIDNLIIENIDKNSNGLELFLNLINENRIENFNRIILHHEATPMKYLIEKLSSFKNVALMTRKELLNEEFE